MNLFLPEETIAASVKALDDRRLIKQILECKAILDVALDETKKGYAKHPVVVYYKDFPKFVVDYGFKAAVEYNRRFGKNHSLYSWFVIIARNIKCEAIFGYHEDPKPFYCEGKKTYPNCIRTTENTVELFRKKLCTKWDNDKYPPKWTNRQPPEWYKNKGGKI